MEAPEGRLEYQVAYEDIENAEEEIDDSKLSQADQLLDTVISIQKEDVAFDIWRDMRASRINDLIQRTWIWKPAKIVGFVDHLGLPEPMDVMGQEIGVFPLRITDFDGTSIKCLAIPSASLSAMVDADSLGRQPISFLGAIVSVRTGKKRKQSEFRFYIKSISLHTYAEDLITDRPGRYEVVQWDAVLVPVPAEKVKRDAVPVVVPAGKVTIAVDEPWYLLHKIIGDETRMTPNALIHHIKRTVAERLRIEGLDGPAAQLGLAIEFCIIQAFSQQRDTYSYKLHSLVIGPPNVGKGFLPKIAAILNPAFEELPANSPKLTSAGLVAHVRRTSKGSQSVPGLLPKVSGGAVAIQDFHEVRGAKRTELFGIFSKLMEDGEVIDRTSGDRVHESVVALHLDTNRYSQVYRDRDSNQMSDIDIPIHILSRFDFITEIPSDTQRQKEISSNIIRGMVMSSRTQQRSLDDWAKEIRMIIAYLRTHYDKVSISDELGDYMRQELERTIQPLVEHPSFKANFQDMQVRVSRSILKMVRAIACANMTNQATKEHVDFALLFIQSKLDFIKSMEPGHTSTVRGSALDQKARRALLADAFKGRSFTAKEALEEVMRTMDGEVEVKTIKRDLKEIGAIIKKKGVWTLK